MFNLDANGVSESVAPLISQDAHAVGVEVKQQHGLENQAVARRYAKSSEITC
jgi:hypothetical protein